MCEIKTDKLMNRIRNGEKEAFREFYDMYNKKILMLAYNITRNFHDAENIVSIVLEKIWYGNFGHVEKLNGFIYKTTKFSALDYLRRNKKNRKELNYTKELERESVSIIDKDMMVTIILGKLKEKYRDVVIRHILFKDTFVEIADVMRVSRFAVQRRYRRAIKTLKQRFGKYDII